jgi:hypothetical protein
MVVYLDSLQCTQKCAYHKPEELKAIHMSDVGSAIRWLFRRIFAKIEASDPNFTPSQQQIFLPWGYLPTEPVAQDEIHERLLPWEIADRVMQHKLTTDMVKFGLERIFTRFSVDNENNKAWTEWEKISEDTINVGLNNVSPLGRSR